MNLRSIRVKNFKAITDSKVVKLEPLTVFIGNNGSGKSSLIEALETYQTIVSDGLDAAMQRWFGIEHIRNKFKPAKERAGEVLNDIEFELSFGENKLDDYRFELAVNSDPKSNRIFLVKDWVNKDGRDLYPRKTETMYITATGSAKPHPIFPKSVYEWQFLNLSPDHMGMPVPQQRTGGKVRLAKNGSNIADYLRQMRELEGGQDALDGIIETMSYVLPYAKDIQPSVTMEIERKTWLQMTEADFKVPGWLLSSGTLRFLSLLALLRHPTPPPLIVVEEIENGLDPRTIHVLVEEIRRVTESKKTQIILTTHSPYLLDKFLLEHIVVVERERDGHPTFRRPAREKELQQWVEDFSPGRLYSMGLLRVNQGRTK